MSPINVQKLAAIAPTSGVGSGSQTTSGAASGYKGALDNGASKPAAQEGVKVELASKAATAEVPVDQSRVDEIRNALKDGTYPIVPTEIADAMIAARLMLGYEE
ncbi:flagellar biosynthesis anti-sigma factor FlgM [Qipengyuania sp. DGS5-3]|uniref:flagellar biosynthesis anti-sigma factor FlgM n=1 Tax=Qipengyuania sp. DGS5-3 TaxID=3349632 RepID=UPI0036D25A05